MPRRLGNGSSPSAKTGMKELFAEPKVKKDGTLSKACLYTPLSIQTPTSYGS